MAKKDAHAAMLEHVEDPNVYQAQPRSVRVLKSRGLPGRELYAVTFTDLDGRDILCACDVGQQADGTWHVHGSAGGGMAGSQSASPRANLGGSPGGGSSGFYFGGRIEGDPRGEVTRVRLVSADSATQDDVVESGVVLFLGERPLSAPVSAELYDRSGMLMARHVVFQHA